jgi:membrane-associated protease RseP (regulator of RpoE activity)
MGMRGMETTKRRGAVAALIALSTGSVLGAQVAVGSVQIRPGNPADSAQVRMMMLMTKGRMDSLATLMREFNVTARGTPEWIELKAKIDSLVPSRGTIFLRSETSAGSAMPRGWIGINAVGPKSQVIGPNGYFVEYFDYPSIVSVDPDSPAQRAGIQPGDVLVGYDGIDVRGHRFDLAQMLVPEKKLAVSVRRDGEAKDYTLTIMPAPVTVADRRREIGQTEIRLREQSPPGDGHYRIEAARGATGVAAVAVGGAGGRAGSLVPLRTAYFSANGMLGAIMSTVSADLAKTLKIDPGVLVTDVTDETPASRSGLKTGDVIVNANGQSVTSLRQLQETLMTRVTSGERSVPIVVVRDKHQQKLLVSW